MDLKTMLFGGHVLPTGTRRVISHDDNPGGHTKATKDNFKEFGRRATKRAIDRANANADRIRIHLMSHPWSTAHEIGDALGLTKSPVYNHLMRFRESGNVEIKMRRVGSYTIVSYKWVEGK